MTDSSLLEFPCRFPIKAMGRSSPGFEALVVELVRGHAPDLGEGAVRCQPSQGGNYLSVTVTIEARSQEQLDAIYRDLTAHPDVVMAL